MRRPNGFRWKFSRPDRLAITVPLRTWSRHWYRMLRGTPKSRANSRDFLSRIDLRDRRKLELTAESIATHQVLLRGTCHPFTVSFLGCSM